MNIIEADLKIIDNNKMLNSLKITTVTKYSRTLQEDRLFTTIEKYIYKKDNGVFEQKQGESPKLKCIFQLHNDRKSSYVSVYDRNGKQIFLGNYLWANESAKSYEEYLKVLKRLHDYKSIVKNFN